ncbi:MAG: biotin--[acetyl-CoA-carboxylase] ligase [Blastochloris sp.]|nr:biotin--[acetyl-CoA-carboxylase] ligase [Blastochloris sp.]
MKPDGSAVLNEVAGWTLHQHIELASTNDSARSLPAWHAVCARRQHAGRGREQRVWISDEGGLWLSLVVPTPGPAQDWQALPLLAAVAVLRVLKSLGVDQARLRWPNDILVGDRKLAGFLVERFHPDRAVVGLGLNLFNHPEQVQPALAGLTLRLADLLPQPPCREELLEKILQEMRRVHSQVLSSGFAAWMGELEGVWQINRSIRLILHGENEPLEGYFLGVNEQGDLRIQEKSGELRTLSFSKVHLLTEH